MWGIKADESKGSVRKESRPILLI